MKIFQVIQKPQARGVELFTSLLSEELVNRGHEVILISIFEGEFILPFSGRQVHLKRHLKNRLLDWKAWKLFAELVKKESPDIIQANAADTLKFTVFSKKFFGWETPLIFRNASIMNTYIKSFWVRKFNEILLNQVDGIASVCQASHLDLLRLYNLERPRLEVIPVGINPFELQEFSNGQHLVELVHIGGFTFEKNHLQILDIFEGIIKKRKGIKLKLIGGGPLFQDIQSEIRCRKLDDEIELLGELAKPFSKLSKNSILILPSKIEGLPAVILEAMYCRVPVIAFGVGGIPEVLKTGKTGWCISPGDKTGFANAIEEVLSINPKEKKQILDQAFEQVNSYYTLPQIALQFEIFYKKLLSPNTPSNS